MYKLALIGVVLIATLGLALEPIEVSPRTELAAVAQFIQDKVTRGLSYNDIRYYRFFTNYAIPKELHKDADHTLNFVLNSTAHFKGPGNIYRTKKIPGHPSISYIDIRDFGWEPQQFELVTSFEPFFVEPFVDHNTYEFTRHVAGNAIMRTDWFIINATDTTWQEDRGIKDTVYHTLLYGQGNAPKNAKEFQDAWRVNIDTIRIEKVERGTIVNHGDSGVSRHTRQLRRGRTLFGYYWETRDVKSHDLDPDNAKQRDFFEDLFANQFDASELITTHKNGSQVYELTLGPTGKFKVINAADPGIVLDKTDLEDVRVRTAKGCIVCHAIGINPATNAVQDFFKKGGDILTRDERLRQDIRAFYLQNLNSLVEDDNKIFERAIKEMNGLTPLQNAQSYLKIYNWYVSPVTPEQAARECGVSMEILNRNLEKATTGRLTYLYRGRSIPRDVWDSLNQGGYIQVQLLINRIDPQDIPRRIAEQQQAFIEEVEVLYDRSPIMDRDNVVVYVNKGQRLRLLNIHDRDWLRVQIGNRPETEGFISTEQARIVTTPTPTVSTPKTKKQTKAKSNINPAGVQTVQKIPQRLDAGILSTASVLNRNKATLVFRVPENAKVFINDWASPGTGVVRTLTTPELSPGTHYYTARVEFQGRSETRKVTVRPGEVTTLEFFK